MNFPDALTGGVLAARFSAPLWLVGSGIGPLSDAYLKSIITLDTLMYILGGPAAISDDMKQLIEERLAHWQEVIMNTTFAVYLNDNWIWGSGWTPGETISVTVNSEDPFFTDDPVSEHGYFDIFVEELTPGDQVTVSDGNMVRTHIVRDLVLIDFSGYQDAGEYYLDVSGTTDTDAHPIRVELLGPSPGPGQGPPTKAEGFAEIMLEAEGYVWDITLLVDIGDEDNIYVFQIDEYGNSTVVHNESGPEPQSPIQVSLSGGGFISGWGWPENQTVSIKIERDGAVEFTEPMVDVNDEGSFDLYLSGVFAMEVGDIITVNHADEIVKTTTLKHLLVTETPENRVIGEAGAGVEVLVTLFVEGVDFHDLPRLEATADTEGKWEVNFDDLGHTLSVDSSGMVDIFDSHGNTTMRYWAYLDPAFNVDTEENSIMGFGWRPESSITVSIDGTDHLVPNPADEHGWFELLTMVQAGDSVTVTDGHTTWTHLVKNLAVTNYHGHSVDRFFIEGTTNSADMIRVTITRGGGPYGPPALLGEGSVEPTLIGPDEYTWEIDFELMQDMEPGDNITIMQVDVNGNITLLRRYA